MSLAVLTNATVTHLRTLLTKDARTLGAQPIPGRPPPNAPEEYIAVWGRATFMPRTNEQSQLLEETYQLGVTISRRVANCPRDRLADKIILVATTGIEAVARSVWVNLNANWSLIAAANLLLPGVNGFLETLMAPDLIPAPEDVDGTWWNAAPDAVSGLTVTMMFRGAKRVQDAVGAT